MEHTEYYQLSLWEQDDRIMMDDFNADNAKLDTAIKANADAIDTLGTSKANAAALGAETTARESADTALGGRIDSEAQARENADSAEATARQSADTALQNALSAESAARAAAVNAINANLGAHGHNCRIATGSYIGAGTHGSTSPNVLTFDFHPLLVMVYSTAGDKVTYPAPMTLLRPHTRARSDSMGTNIGDSNILTVTWSDKSVSWWATLASYQNNVSGATYHYAAIGYDKDAENV